MIHWAILPVCIWTHTDLTHFYIVARLRVNLLVASTADHSVKRIVTKLNGRLEFVRLFFWFSLWFLLSDMDLIIYSLTRLRDRNGISILQIQTLAASG